MIRRSILALTVLTLMVCMASILFARGAPPGKKAFTPAVAVKTAPTIVANVAPVMTGYVIQNLTTETRDLAIAQTYSAGTSASRGQSTTVNWRANANGHSSTIGNRTAGVVLRT